MQNSSPSHHWNEPVQPFEPFEPELALAMLFIACCHIFVAAACNASRRTGLCRTAGVQCGEQKAGSLRLNEGQTIVGLKRKCLQASLPCQLRPVPGVLSTRNADNRKMPRLAFLVVVYYKC